MGSTSNSISLDESELEFIFTKASGPGGQNVNKVSTAVQLRFNVDQSRLLSDAVKQRLIKLAGNRVTDSSILIIDARNYRTQLKNKSDAVSRLVDLIKAASIKPKLRKPTRPTKQSRLNRLESKKQRGDIKQLRKTPKESSE